MCLYEIYTITTYTTVENKNLKKYLKGNTAKSKKIEKCIVSKIFTKKQDSVFNLTSYSNSVKSTQKY